MIESFEAIYEGGVLRPLTPVHLAEHSTVTVTVQSEYRHPVTECAGTISEQDAQEMRSAIDDEFERVDPHEWK